jgi:hypothetical protein
MIADVLLPSAAVRSRDDHIRVDLFGVIVPVEPALVLELRDAAAERAGDSSRHRDLSLLLDRSLTTETLTLRRHELRTLLRLTAASPERFRSVVADLQQAADRARAG